MLMISILPLAITSFILLSKASDSLKQQAFNQLESVREIKKGQVEDYFSVIEKQIITLAETPFTINAMSDFKAQFNTLADSVSHQQQQYKNKLTDYYQQEFALKFEQQNNTRPEVNQLIPNNAQQITAQYLYIANNSNPLGEKHQLLTSDDESAYSQSHAKYHPLFKNFLERFGYYDIFLVDPKTGNIVYSVFKEIDYATSLETGVYKNSAIGEAYRKAKQATTAGSTFLIDFDKYRPSYDAPASFISTPLFKGNSQELLGILIFQMPVDNINAIMQEKAGLGESGETYLLADDLLMRSQSRFTKENTIFSTKVDTKAASQVFNGKTGHVIANDYRGTPVLSSYAPILIAGLNWALLAEIDKAEVFESINSLTLFVIIALIFALFAVAGIIWFVMRGTNRQLGADPTNLQRFAE